MLYVALLQSLHFELFGSGGTAEDMIEPKNVLRLPRVTGPVTDCRLFRLSVTQRVLLLELRDESRSVTQSVADVSMI